MIVSCRNRWLKCISEMIAILYDLCSYCHSSRPATSNRTRHKVQYGYGMTHDHIGFLPFYTISCAVNYSVHVIAYITYITLGDTSVAESESILFACSKSNYLQPTFSLSLSFSAERAA